MSELAFEEEYDAIGRPSPEHTHRRMYDKGLAAGMARNEAVVKAAYAVVNAPQDHMGFTTKEGLDAWDDLADAIARVLIE
jgi:hypothetical protein